MTNETAPQQNMSVYKKGWILFFIYFKVMLFAFTGGMAATPSLIHEIVKKNKFLSEEDYLRIIALSSSLPGVIGVNNSILAGHKIAGTWGAFMAVMGTVVPAFVSMLLVATLFRELPESKLMRGAINGIRAVSVAVLMDMGIRIFIRFRKDGFGIALFMFALCLPLFTPVSAFYTILLAGAMGIIYYVWRQRDSSTTGTGASS